MKKKFISKFFGTAYRSCGSFAFDLQRFDSTFSGGDGSKDNPYQISSVADLQQLSTDVNGGNSYSGKFFQLTTNLDLKSVNFTPIGNYNVEKAFEGTFDGNNSNYTISNLKISASRDTQGTGLFAYNKGTIKNVTLLDVDVECTGIMCPITSAVLSA